MVFSGCGGVKDARYPAMHRTSHTMKNCHNKAPQRHPELILLGCLLCEVRTRTALCQEHSCYTFLRLPPQCNSLLLCGSSLSYSWQYRFFSQQSLKWVRTMHYLNGLQRPSVRKTEMSHPSLVPIKMICNIIQHSLEIVK